jgi:hypothetical protein
VATEDTARLQPSQTLIGARPAQVSRLVLSLALIGVEALP